MSKIPLRLFLKNKREILDLSQQEVADYLGISKSAISRWESGDIKNMGIDKLKKLSEVLKIDPMTIVNYNEYLQDDDAYYVNEEQSIYYTNNVDRIPLLGRIAAGYPILAEENIEDYFNIDTSLEADFCLKIKGDSMIDEGIYDGDIVFIRKQDTLENGEIGAILIDDEATLKTFYRDNGNVVLQPANKNYIPLVFTNGNLRILGKLVAILNIRD